LDWLVNFRMSTLRIFSDSSGKNRKPGLLLSQRRNRDMNPDDHNAATPMNPSSNPADPARPRPLARRRWLRLGGAALAFGAIVRFVPRDGEDGPAEREPWLSHPEPKQPGPSREARVAEARREIAEIARTYEEVQGREVAAARRGVEGALAKARRLAPGSAEEAATPFQGLSNMVRCAFRGAADRIDGGERLQGYCEEALAPAVHLSVAAAGETDALLVAVHRVSVERANRFHDDTLALARDFGLEPAELRLGDGLARDWQRSLDGLFSKRRTAAIATGLEAALIGFTYRSIASLLASAIAKLAKTGSAAAIAAVADGPLPIGDAIAVVLAVGGTIWTVNDIRKAVKVGEALPGEIEQALLAEFASLDNAAQDYLRHLEQACGSAFRSVL